MFDGKYLLTYNVLPACDARSLALMYIVVSVIVQLSYVTLI